jgi:hypothetical protein
MGAKFSSPPQKKNPLLAHFFIVPRTAAVTVTINRAATTANRFIETHIVGFVFRCKNSLTRDASS